MEERKVFFPFESNILLQSVTFLNLLFHWGSVIFRYALLYLNLNPVQAIRQFTNAKTQSAVF